MMIKSDSIHYNCRNFRSLVRESPTTTLVALPSMEDDESRHRKKYNKKTGRHLLNVIQAVLDLLEEEEKSDHQDPQSHWNRIVDDVDDDTVVANATTTTVVHQEPSKKKRKGNGNDYSDIG